MVSGQVSVDTSDDLASIGNQILDKASATARDLALDLANTAAGRLVHGAVLDWGETASAILGSAMGAGELAKNGQMGAAVDAVQTAFKEIVPDAIGNAVTIRLASPTIVEAIVIVGVGEVALPAAAIGVTAVVVAIGLGTVARMTGEQVAQLAKKVIDNTPP